MHALAQHLSKKSIQEEYINKWWGYDFANANEFVAVVGNMYGSVSKSGKPNVKGLVQYYCNELIL